MALIDLGNRLELEERSQAIFRAIILVFMVRAKAKLWSLSRITLVVGEKVFPFNFYLQHACTGSRLGFVEWRKVFFIFLCAMMMMRSAAFKHEKRKQNGTRLFTLSMSCCVYSTKSNLWAFVRNVNIFKEFGSRVGFIFQILFPSWFSAGCFYT